jgi:hypothetical protein
MLRTGPQASLLWKADATSAFSNHRSRSIHCSSSYRRSSVLVVLENLCLLRFEPRNNFQASKQLSSLETTFKPRNNFQASKQHGRHVPGVRCSSGWQLEAVFSPKRGGFPLSDTLSTRTMHERSSCLIIDVSLFGRFGFAWKV